MTRRGTPDLGPFSAQEQPWRQWQPPGRSHRALNAVLIVFGVLVFLLFAIVGVTRALTKTNHYKVGDNVADNRWTVVVDKVTNPFVPYSNCINATTVDELCS